MSINNFKANKKFGQHFLIDQAIIDAITEDNVDETKFCLEVGPGPGVLTKKLVDRDFDLKVVEIDNQFISFLKELVGDDNVTHQDALDVDLKQKFMDWNWEKKIWLVSNLPYNVAAPLMIKFFPNLKIDRMTLMMQKEMGDRVLPKNKKKPSNPLAVYAFLFFEVTRLCEVPPESFSPPPKVNSSVLTFARRESPLLPIEQYEEFLKFGRAFFATPRKQLHKVLKSNLSGFDWPQAFEELNIPAGVRGEALEPAKVLELYFAYKKGIN